MNVLSLFDGFSGAKIALDNLGIDCNYYASEIDKYPESISKYHYPSIMRLGDVENIKIKDLPKIDLIIGGSPCQGFSVSGKRKGFKDPRSKLFFKFVELVDELKPKYFILENVRMKKAWLDIISKHMKTDPVFINSALVTAQNRVRAYWANFPITQPKDRGIVLKNIIEEGIADRNKSYCIDANYFKGGNLNLYFNKNKRQLVFGDWGTGRDKEYNIAVKYNRKDGIKNKLDKSLPVLSSDWRGINRNQDQTAIAFKSVALPEARIDKPLRIGEIGKGGQGQRIYGEDGKSITISAESGGPGAKTGLYAIAQRGRYEDGVVKQQYEIGSGEKSNTITSVNKDSMIATEDGQLLLVRKLTPVECERLQGLEDDWTKWGINEKGETVQVSNSQRYKALGNGFTIPVIEHILKEVLC